MFEGNWRLGVRTLGWGSVVGVLTAVGVTVACFCIMGTVHALDPTSFIDWRAETLPPTDAFERDVVFNSVACAFWYAPRGFLMGVLCGLLTSHRSLNPFSCSLLWQAVRAATLQGLAVFFGVSFCLWVLITMLDSVGQAAFGAMIWLSLLLDVGSFGIGQWRVLKHAIDTEKAQSSHQANPASTVLL